MNEEKLGVLTVWIWTFFYIFCDKRLYCNKYTNYIPKNILFYFLVKSPALLGLQFTIVHSLNLGLSKNNNNNYKGKIIKEETKEVIIELPKMWHIPSLYSFFHTLNSSSSVACRVITKKDDIYNQQWRMYFNAESESHRHSQTVPDS